MKRSSKILGLALFTAGFFSASPSANAFDDNSSVSSTLSMEVPAASTLTKSQRTKLELTTGLLGRSLEDEYANSKYAGALFGLKGGFRVSDVLDARWNVKAIMTSGTATNQYSESGKAPNGLWVDEAAVKYQPSPFLSAEAGVILTEFSSLPSNFDSMGFPGLRETVLWGDEDMKGRLFAMQAIPSSDTVAVQPTEDGKTTQLFIYGASFASDVRGLSRLSVSAGAVYFDFQNLNSSAATDSRLMGNTVVPVGRQAKFQYDFRGYEASGEISYRISPEWTASLNGAALVNQGAPEGLNKGYLYAAGLAMPLWGMEGKITGGYFYNEPDTLPASYTSAGKGANNRFGQIARFSVSDKKEKVLGFVQYTRANMIENRPYMADREIYVMGLEVGYEIL